MNVLTAELNGAVWDAVASNVSTRGALLRSRCQRRTNLVGERRIFIDDLPRRPFARLENQPGMRGADLTRLGRQLATSAVDGAVLLCKVSCASICNVMSSLLAWMGKW